MPTPSWKLLLGLVGTVQELLYSVPPGATGDCLSGQPQSGLLPLLLVEAENSGGGNC